MVAFLFFFYHYEFHLQVQIILFFVVICVFFTGAVEGPIQRTREGGVNGSLSGSCRCLNLSTSMGGTRSKVEDGDRHGLEPDGTREDTRHKIYTGSGSQSSYPTSCLE
jgi:hypothetical protein